MSFLHRALCICLLTWTLSVSQANAFPSPHNAPKERLIRHDYSGRSASAEHSLANGTTLRIQPLGASITYGYRSTDGNGYRKSLRNQLVCAGNDVNMIGSRSNGTMQDNQVEGWSGYVITTMAQKAELSIYDLPNVVLINVGTNDAVQDIDIPNAASRLSTLVNHLLDVDANVTVIVSTILPNGNETAEGFINGTINPGYRNLVTEAQAQGKKVGLAEMHDGYITLDDLHDDGTHPLDEGYVKMANVWYKALQEVDAKGWITPPHAVDGVNDNSVRDICDDEV